MSSKDLAVSVRGLSKSYVISHNLNRPTNLREAIVERVKYPFGVSAQERETFWALNDVDFDIRQGESIGILGRNGAGKSTLLKILSRITYPTRGVVDIYGRVASLLEVGTGFHGELTGRENIALNGSILGMSRREIKNKFDEIVAFAEIDKFLDTPVKRYSSGMYVRLAFAVAAHLDPEILIVDEVLAVGDVAFQKKCLGKMRDVSGQGRTVLLVSHQMQTIQAMAKRAVLLEQGRVTKIGSTADVVSYYMGASRSNYDMNNIQHTSTEDARLLNIRVTTDEDDDPREVVLGNVLSITIAVKVHRPMIHSNAAIALRNGDGIALFSHTWTDQHKNPLTLNPGCHSFNVRVPTEFLRPGPHWLTLNISKNEAQVVVGVQDLELPPLVLNSDANLILESRRWGIVYVPCEWQHRSDFENGDFRGSRSKP